MNSHVPPPVIAAEQPAPSLLPDLLKTARYYLLSRMGLLGLAAVMIFAGAALNWNWLVASGIGPLLVALLPCAVMCAVGLCAHRIAGRSCAQEQAHPTAQADETEASRGQLDLFEPAAVATAQLNDSDEARHAAAPDPAATDERKPTHA